MCVCVHLCVCVCVCDVASSTAFLSRFPLSLAFSFLPAKEGKVLNDVKA